MFPPLLLKTALPALKGCVSRGSADSGPSRSQRFLQVWPTNDERVKVPTQSGNVLPLTLFGGMLHVVLFRLSSTSSSRGAQAALHDKWQRKYLQNLMKAGISTRDVSKKYTKAQRAYQSCNCTCMDTPLALLAVVLAGLPHTNTTCASARSRDSLATLLPPTHPTLSIQVPFVFTAELRGFHYFHPDSSYRLSLLFFETSTSQHALSAEGQRETD